KHLAFADLPVTFRRDAESKAWDGRAHRNRKRPGQPLTFRAAFDTRVGRSSTASPLHFMPYSFRRFTPRPYLLLAAALSCVLAVIAYGRSPARIPVQFSITVDVGFGNSVFVVGD